MRNEDHVASIRFKLDPCLVVINLGASSISLHGFPPAISPPVTRPRLLRCTFHVTYDMLQLGCRVTEGGQSILLDPALLRCRFGRNERWLGVVDIPAEWGGALALQSSARLPWSPAVVSTATKISAGASRLSCYVVVMVVVGPVVMIGVLVVKVTSDKRSSPPLPPSSPAYLQ